MKVARVQRGKPDTCSVTNPLTRAYNYSTKKLIHSLLDLTIQASEKSRRTKKEHGQYRLIISAPCLANKNRRKRMKLYSDLRGFFQTQYRKLEKIWRLQTRIKNKKRRKKAVEKKQ